MVSRKRRLFAKVVSIIMLASIVMTSNGIAMAAEAKPTQTIAINQENEKTETVTEKNWGENFVTESEGTNEMETSNNNVSSLVKSNTSTNMIASENSGISLLTSSNDLVSEDYTYTVLDNKVTITGYTGNSATVSIPSRIEEYMVTTIGSSAFKGNIIISNLILPNTITSIGSSAFANCTALMSVTMNYNSTVEYSVSIGESAFSGCTSLTNIQLSENVTNIGEYAFSGCTALSSLILPESVTSLGLGVIQSTAINSITIPRNVTYGGYVSSDYYGGALAGCKGLKEVIFENGMTKIPDYICTTGSYGSTCYVEKIVIPDSVTEIGSSAFYKCDNLIISSLPSNIKKIGDYAFSGCSKINTMLIPKTITGIGKSAFANCAALTTVTMNYNSTVEYSVSIGESAFSGCTSLTNIQLSENVTNIGEYAFSGCTALSSLILPESVTSLGLGVIQSTAINSITIPRNVTYGGYVSSDYYGGALAGCKGLKEVIFENGMTKIPDYICTTGSYGSTCYVEKVVIPHSVNEIGNHAFYKCDNMTIYGYTNSYAETYADENNIPFMDIGEMESGGYDSYVVGSLSSVDALGGTVTINGTTYNVSEDLDLSSVTTILTSDYKTVIALKKDDVLITLDGVKDVIEPKVELHLTATKAVYQNGAFEHPSFNIQVDETVSVKKPYSKSMLSGVEDAGVTFSSLKLTNKENVAKISELNSSKKKYSLELTLNETVKPGGKSYQTYLVNFDDDYVPNSTNSTISFEALAGSNAGESTAVKTLPVGNLDIASAKKQQNTSVTSAKNELSNPSDLGIAVELGFSSSYIATSEIPNIKRCITTWVADLIAVRSLVADDETGIIDKIKKQAKKSEDQLVSAVLSAAGINNGVLTKLTKTKASTQIKTKDKNGKEVTVYVALDMGYYAFKDDAPYGGFGSISISVEDSSGYLHKNIDSGMVTYSSMSTFVDKLKSVAESSIKGVYDSAWGNSADKVAEIFVGETITKIMKNYGYSFSGGVFNLITNPGKTVTKSVGTHCPVDVYVYDSQGKLRGSIVNNEVVQTDDELFLYVDGDEKYVYVMNDDYTFKLVGSDEGKMDYDVTTYVDGEVERIIEYKDIPLNNNVAYYGYVPENVYNANLLYDLVAEEGDTLSADSDNYEGAYQIFTESISLNNENLKLNVGDKRTLSATVLPTNTTNGLLYWTSSDDKIAKVDETTGEVEAIEQGTAIITATTLDGLSAECAVEVMAEDGNSGNETPKPTDKPDSMTSPKPTTKPDATGIPKPTDKPNATENPDSTDGINTTNGPLKGTVLKDSKNKVAYKVIEQGKTVAFYKVDNKKVTKVVIPAAVSLNGIKYKVIAISDNAFNGCKKLKSVTIGKFITTIGNKAFFKCTTLKKITIPASVTKIGKKAFYGCKKLKSITIKTKKLKSKSVGTQAFKGIYKKAVVKVPKKQKKAYQKWLRKKGITKKMKIK